MYEALLPSGPLISSVLQYVWALWEDPIDVRQLLILFLDPIITTQFCLFP